MSENHISKEQSFAAPADRVYGVIADYARHHRNFLPAAFSDYRVEKGGYGAGTTITYRLKIAGSKRPCRAHIEEPEPGRVLEERMEDGNSVTTFTVTPDGTGSVLRIETRWQSRRGIAGRIESALVPRALMPLYEQEMRLLDRYVSSSAKEPIAAD